MVKITLFLPVIIEVKGRLVVIPIISCSVINFIVIVVIVIVVIVLAVII